MKKLVIEKVEIIFIVLTIFIVVSISTQSHERYVKQERRDEAQKILLWMVARINQQERLEGLRDYKIPGIVADNEFYDFLLVKNKVYTRLFAMPKGEQANDGKLQATTTGIMMWDRNNDAPDPSITPDADRKYEVDL